MDFEFVTIIDRPPAAVFSFFRDIEQHAGRPGSVVPVYDKLTPGPARVDTRYRELVRILPFWQAEVISEIVRLEPNRLLELEFHFGRAMTGALIYELETVGEGTRVTQRQSLQPGWVLKLFSPFIRPAFAQVAGRRLKSIKRILEDGG